MLEQLEPRRLLSIFTPADGEALKAAIDAANADPGHDVIELSGGLFGVDTLPAIVSDLTIQNGSIERQGEPTFEPFIKVDEGRLTLDRVLVTGGVGFYGGAIANYAELKVQGSTISGNTAESGYGGGIFNYGQLDVQDSEFRDNSSLHGQSYGGHGGAIYNSGVARISASTFESNRASNGGAIFNVGRMHIVDSEITGNMAEGFNQSHTYLAGGIDNRGALTTVNSTITGNTNGDVENGSLWASQVRGKLKVYASFWKAVVDFEPDGESVRVVANNERHSLESVFSGVRRIVAFGTDSDDVIRVSPEISIPARLIGNAGDDLLVGGSGNDVLIGRAGADALRGMDGDDVLRGNSGPDILDGGEGEDRIIPGAGNDTVLSLDAVFADTAFTVARSFAWWSKGLLDKENLFA